MDWTFKYAFREIDELYKNSPWLLVDDQLVEHQNDPDEQGNSFLSVQKQLMLQRGWDWFRTVIRGRFFPNLNVTTVTTLEAERNPEMGDPQELIERVREKFFGVTLISLIGEPHVIEGTGSIPPDMLRGILRHSRQQKWHASLEKTAMFKKADDDESDFVTPYYKDEFQFEIADVDRYATDKYFANLTLLETDNLYSIGFQMYNYQVGITGAVQYWHYEKNELDRAKKAFNEIKTALIETMSGIEYHRPPMAVITPMVRAALQNIDIGRKERSGNYFHNWFEELPKESDWRTTIYGDRYPSATIQHIDAFWNTDDASKEISAEGASSRSRVLKYKPSHGTISKCAADNSRLQQLLSDAWKIPASLGTGAVLAWLLSLGISPAQLEQQLQNGATPQQIITQVSPEKSSFETGNTQFPSDNGDFAENSVETLDNSPKTTRMSRELDTRNLDGLDPMFVEKVKQVLAVLAEKGWQPRVASGLRSIEQQQEKIDQGTSSLKAPQNSKHVQGLAADIIDSRYGWEGKASDLNFQFWNDLGQAAKEVGLVWGGDWKSFKDVAHVEAQASTTGSSAAVYRHAYQGINWVEAREFVKQLADRGFLWHVKGGPCVIDELQQAGVSSDLIRRLKPIYDQKTNNAWSHIYVKLGSVSL